MAIPQEKLDELKSKHRRIEAIDVDGHDIVFRAPSRPEYKVWRAQKSEPYALEDLVRKCIVYVDGVDGDWATVVAKFDELLEVYPGITDGPLIAKPLSAFMGITQSETGKK